jgi:enoyl-CoA hydratase/carnithine racemase
MSQQDLLYLVSGPVARFTINREKNRNALSPEAIALFLKYLDEAANDPSVRVLCVTGAGDKAFCAGADLGGSMGKGDKGAKDAFGQYAGLLKKLSAFPKPVVARVNGPCVAGGTGIMLACDIVIAVSTAKFGTPEVNVGLWPMMIGALIFKNVPRKKAMEMILLGERLDAAKALEMGMVTRVVEPEKLDEEVNSVLETLAQKSPIGMKIGKQAFYAMQDMPFEQALDYLAGKIGEVAGTQDAIEGITAFIEKRKPNFTGK